MTDPKLPARVVIADDEPLARERLRTLLADQSWVQIVAECQNGSEAVDAVNLARCRGPGHHAIASHSHAHTRSTPAPFLADVSIVRTCGFTYLQQPAEPFRANGGRRPCPVGP